MEKSPHDIAVRFWRKPLSIDEAVTPKGKRFRLFNIPYYYAGQVGRLILKYI